MTTDNEHQKDSAVTAFQTFVQELGAKFPEAATHLQDQIQDIQSKLDAMADLVTTPKDMHPELGIPMGATVANPVSMVYFQAGLLAARQSIAQFFAASSPILSNRIQHLWWAGLDEDPGSPRLLNFDELADGGEEGPWVEKTISVSVEALPIAHSFVIAPGYQIIKQAAALPPDPPAPPPARTVAGSD